MRSKYCIGIVLLFLCNMGCAQQNDAQSQLLTKVVEVTQNNHIAPKPLDNKLSQSLLSSFLKQVDPDKKIFLAEEVAQMKVAEEKIDDEFRSGTTKFLAQVVELLGKGLARAEKLANNCLENEIEVFVDDFFESNPAKRSFLDEKGLEKRWALVVKQQYIKDLYLLEVVAPGLDFEELRPRAMEKTKAYFKNYFEETASKTEGDWLEVYVNTYLALNDYQSNFLSPKERAVWDKNFTRNFVGVGISLQATADYPLVMDVLLDGPAWKTKMIRKGDFLTKVANEEGQWIDVAGMPLGSVIELLKGASGTKVMVKIQSFERMPETVEIERGPVSLPKTMSFILEDKMNSKKLGYLYLPRFYTEESCAAHVLAELEKLRQQPIEGLILDLRNNQGGSASEAREIIGYFLQGEMVMHTVYANGDHRRYDDEDSAAQYAGKLIVLVNEGSSSAAELLSGTLQDYKRAIVVGSQTYGKGTVQRFFEIRDDVDSSKLGDVKLSIAKFYTGNGRSTQFNGVRPDITLPSLNMYVETGERAVENALEFENLSDYAEISDSIFEQNLSQIAKRSQARQSENAYFQAIEKAAKLKQQKSENTLVNLNYYVYQKKMLENTFIEIEGLEKIAISPSSNSALDAEKVSYWLSQLANDEYLFEAMLILEDALVLGK